jgi:GMP synthase-like glutamine amidotransferase
MKIGILETGRPSAALEGRFGRYDGMLIRLLGEHYQTQTYAAMAGDYPERPEDQDAYLITGSAAGVYDRLPWIPGLKVFLQQAKGKAKLVGICFGHQIMAEAFGGRVEKSDKGWGVGLHRYEVRHAAPWMDPVDGFSIPVSHQDQIVRQPPQSRVVAASPFTKFGALAYDDQPAISFQCHPEFEPEFARALIEERRARVPDPDAAIASLREPNDGPLVGSWIRRFLNGSSAADA